MEPARRAQHAQCVGNGAAENVIIHVVCSGENQHMVEGIGLEVQFAAIGHLKLGVRILFTCVRDACGITVHPHVASIEELAVETDTAAQIKQSLVPPRPHVGAQQRLVLPNSEGKQILG